MDEDTGVFVLSLDTELAWGMFDLGRVDEFEAAYRQTPSIIEHLCNLFDEYRIPATWAIVSHLLTDCEGDSTHVGQSNPDFEWVDDWFGALPCTDGLDRDLWYAPWLLDRLRSCQTEQEIGLHGATHMPLGADGCSAQNAREELGSAIETLNALGEDPQTFIFPRNDIGHLDVLRETQMQVYREVDARWYETPRLPSALKPPLRFADEALHQTPPAVTPSVHDGLVAVPGSQIFRPTHGGWQYTPSKSTVKRAEKGIERAARTGGVFHLWFHPFNLGHEPKRDLQRLEDVLAVVDEFADRGQIERRSMQEVAELALNGRWE
ncbi:polysaccharide deacetylase family protein [Haloarcula nitratireducens]|uniref:DUF2334 domain-containing protein n=1 Tax=Haloarcula nitratireducens TaxID=2487749 RepID=A0AAW4PFM5_9EURY|nr:polysaccharide deacetylase family protein [Halomicroarcula nitratireducens]MBX0296639.1 DUF2334 domain-containing protein [Halomicroarcula nitratireducens]